MSDIAKKKRRKKTSIGSGRTITQSAYDTMLTSYLEHRSIKQAASDACVAPETAQKYIDVGTAQFPAIRSRVDKIMERARQEEDDALVQQRHFFQENLLEIAQRAADVLPSLKFCPRHQHVVDKDGEIVLGKNGSPLMAVDEVTLSKLVDIFGKISEILGNVPGSGQLQQGQQIQVQTNVHIDYDAVKSEVASAIRKLGKTQSLMVGTDKELEVRSALAKEAVRRAELQEVEVIED